MLASEKNITQEAIQKKASPPDIPKIAKKYPESETSSELKQKNDADFNIKGEDLREDC
jgi:hypothetical protein